MRACPVSRINLADRHARMRLRDNKALFFEVPLMLNMNTAVRQLSEQIQLARIIVVKGSQRPVTKQLM